MSQEKVRSEVRATYVGLETTHGEVPDDAFPHVMTRIFPTGKKFILGGLVREVHAVDDEGVRRLDARTPVAGLQVGAKLEPMEMNLKTTPVSARLVAGATPGNLSPRILLRACLGAEYCEEGSTCSTGSDPDTVNVQTGDGALFRIGTWILVQVGTELEPTLITNIVSDALSVHPALSGSPVDTAVVRQLYNYCQADAHTSSLCVQQAMKDSASNQWTCVGCVGDVSFNFPKFGEIPTMSVALQVSSYTGPSAQGVGVGVAAAADEMGPTFIFRPEVYLAASIVRGTTTRCSALGIEQKNDWSAIADPAAPNCVSDHINVGGRPTAASGTMKSLFDQAQYALFVARTPLHYLVINKVGSGLTATFWIFELPNCTLDQDIKPEEMDRLVYQTLAFNGIPDTRCTTTGLTGEALDFALACLRVAYG